MKKVIVGLGGGTASGKTYLSDLLQAQAQPGEVLVIRTDFYYRPTHHLSKEERNLLNYDHPDQVEHELLLQHLNLLQEHHPVPIPVSIPQYDFATHNRKQENIAASPAPIIIIEGILALHYQALRAHYDHSLFVDADSHLRKKRRLARDTIERGRSPESVETQWQNTVHPMHEIYCEPSKEYADSIIDGRNISQQTAARTLEDLRRILRKK